MSEGDRPCIWLIIEVQRAFFSCKKKQTLQWRVSNKESTSRAPPSIDQIKKFNYRIKCDIFGRWKEAIKFWIPKKERDNDATHNVTYGLRVQSGSKVWNRST